MKREIILHGYLKDLYDKPITVEADTVAEALRALNQIEELQRDHPHAIVIEGVDSNVALFSKSDIETIHVYPMTEGGGGRSFTQIVLGVFLIGLGLFLGPAGIATASGTWISGGNLILTGALMLTGGLLQLLAPTPDTEKEGSQYLGSPENTVQIGTRIPILYGTRKIGGHYLSFDVDAVDWSGREGDTGIEDDTFTPDGLFIEYDKPVWSTGVAVVRPRYLSNVTGPANMPTSDWSQA